MKMKLKKPMKQLVMLAAASMLTLSAMAGPRTSILNVRTDITDNDIVFPESFETDTREMLKNWYLQNYAVLDAEVENRDAGDVSDAVIIKRLQAIPTTIELPYNQVVRSYIDRYVKRGRTLVEEMLGLSLYYMPIFEQALEKERLPLELKYLPVIESAMNPNAVSRAGAAGLWQFMVGTGKGLGLEVSTLVDERRDPYKSSDKAAKFLKNLYDIYGDWSLAIAAYNCGPGNVNKALRRAGGEKKDFWDIYDYLPKETRGYVPAFIAATYVMTYYKHHNISPSLAKRPLITDTVGVSRRIHFNQISKVLNVSLDELRALNPQYRCDVIPGSKSRPYTLVLPSQQIYAYIMSEDSISGYMASAYTPRQVVEPGGRSRNNYNDDTDITVVDHSGENGQDATSKEGEDEQIAEVQEVQKQAQDSHRHRVKVDVPAPPKKQTKPTPSVVPPAPQRQQSGGHTTRVEVRTDPKQTSKQETYQQSHSSSSRERTDARRQTAAQQQHQQHQQAPKQQAPTAKAQAPAAKAQAPAAKAQAPAKTHATAKAQTPAKAQQKQTKVQAQAPAKPTSHSVKKGESLSEIAEKNGVSVSELKKANNLKGDNIRAGENLKIPSKGGKAQAQTPAKGAKAQAQAPAKGGRAQAQAKGGKAQAQAPAKGAKDNKAQAKGAKDNKAQAKTTAKSKTTKKH